MIIDANGGGGRKALREATAACHQRVDDLFSGLDLGRREDYALFLRAQAAAFVPVEAALDAAGIEALVPDWTARRRSIDLLADLNALSVAYEAPLAAPTLSGEAELLGALYVLEGSRLGGQMLKRAVPEGLPVSFLAAGDAGSWRALTQMLDARLGTPDEIAAATKAAMCVFDMFERAGARLLSGERVA